MQSLALSGPESVLTWAGTVRCCSVDAARPPTRRTGCAKPSNCQSSVSLESYSTSSLNHGLNFESLKPWCCVPPAPALRARSCWSAKCLTWSIVTRAHATPHPRSLEEFADGGVHPWRLPHTDNDIYSGHLNGAAQGC